MILNYAHLENVGGWAKQITCDTLKLATQSTRAFFRRAKIELEDGNYVIGYFPENVVSLGIGMFVIVTVII